MNRVSVRKLTDKDIPQIINIERAIIKKKVSGIWSQNLKTHIKKEGVIGFVAIEKTNVVGYIIGEIMGLGFGIGKSGWIEVVEVDPKYMGTGIGKILAKKIFDHFKKMNIKGIYTAVSWDAGDMLSFFKSVGFDRTNFITLGKHLE